MISRGVGDIIVLDLSILIVFYIYYIYLVLSEEQMNKRIFFLFLLIIFILCLTSCSRECKHLYISKSVLDPTCSDEGKTLNQCLDCSFFYYSDYTAPSGHTLSSKATEPTCSEEGATIYTCDCGYSYLSDFIPPKNHSFIPTVIESTCLESGYTAYYCNCGYSYKSDYTPPLNHDYETSLTLEATCSTAGRTEQTCNNCKAVSVLSITEPLGHTIKAKVIRPTCLEGGHTLNTCSTCGYSYKSDFVFYSDIINSAFVDNTTVLAKGLDVSRWNHSVAADGSYLPLDWGLIRAQGFEFTILKIGSTLRNGGRSGGIEPTFELDYADAKAAGFDVGAYFYTYAHSVEEIRADALALLEYLKGKKFEYPIYLDMEEDSQKALGKSLLGDMCAEFISILQKEGYYAAVYLNNSWLIEAFDKIEMTNYFDLWYARYVSDSAIPVWNAEKYGEQLGMWQFTQTGTISGIYNIKEGKQQLTAFCFDYAYRDYPSLIKKWHLNGY